MAYADNEFLTFMKVDCDLNEEEYIFDGQFLNDPKYIVDTFLGGKQTKLNFGINNMRPIIDAFQLKKRMS